MEKSVTCLTTGLLSNTLSVDAAFKAFAYITFLYDFQVLLLNSLILNVQYCLAEDLLRIISALPATLSRSERASRSITARFTTGH